MTRVFYEYDLVPDGGKFYVYKENHSKEALAKAKSAIRWKDDVVTLQFVRGTPNKERLTEFDQYVEVESQ